MTDALLTSCRDNISIETAIASVKIIKRRNRFYTQYPKCWSDAIMGAVLGRVRPQGLGTSGKPCGFAHETISSSHSSRITISEQLTPLSIITLYTIISFIGIL